MASRDDDFRLLMQRAIAGSDDAARQIVERYGASLLRAVRRALGPRLRCRFDSRDFTQRVWCSFFRDRDRLMRFDRPSDLVAFLVAMVRNKVCTEARRRLRTEKHEIRRERERIAEWATEEGEPLDGGPAAIDVAIARERLEGLLSDQPPGVREIIELRLEGLTHEEIAESLTITRGTVHRVLKKLYRNEE